MIPLARLLIARALLGLGECAVELAGQAAWPHPGREVLWLSDACARLVRVMLVGVKADLSRFAPRRDQEAAE